jgi:hypothetical protein
MLQAVCMAMQFEELNLPGNFSSVDGFGTTQGSNRDELFPETTGFRRHLCLVFRNLGDFLNHEKRF